MLHIAGCTYELIRASEEDGMSVECWRLDSRDGPVLRAHFRDCDSRFLVTACENDLPFDLVEAFIHAAREGLPPRESERG